MNWLLKTLLAIVLIVFAFDAKNWIGRAWGVAVDEPTSRFESVVDGRITTFDAAASDAARKVAANLAAGTPDLLVSKVLVSPGARVTSGQPLVELVSPRASYELRASVAGEVASVTTAVGQVAKAGAALLSIRNSEGVETTEAVDGDPLPGERPTPISVLPIAEDLERRATTAIEAALLEKGWNVESRASLSDSMSQADLRSMVERLWDKVSPTDLFDRHGVDRLAFGRILHVEFPGPERCNVDLEIRAIDREGKLLFSARAQGAAGPEPTLVDYAAAHPLRICGALLFLVWLGLLLYFRSRAVPHLDRAKQEALDTVAVEAGRAFSKSVQELLVDLRRIQDEHQRLGQSLLVRSIANEVDRLDQIRQAVESLSRKRHREASASGFWPQAELAALQTAVRGYPVSGAEHTSQTAIDALRRSVDSLRDAVRSRTTT